MSSRPLRLRSVSKPEISSWMDSRWGLQFGLSELSSTMKLTYEIETVVEVWIQVVRRIHYQADRKTTVTVTASTWKHWMEFGMGNEWGWAH